MVGRLVSFWDGFLAGAMLVSGSVPFLVGSYQISPGVSSRCSLVSFLTKDTPKAAGIHYNFWEGLERLANLSLGCREVRWLDPHK